MANDAFELARRFEPILYFHPGERFFPSDAKRYVEHCALWSAVAPFDQKTSWSRLIASKKITASGALGELEPGDSYLGQAQPIAPGGPITAPFLVNTSTEEHFFELGGWSIPAGFRDGGPPTVVANNEPTVDGTSFNLYADRDEVAKQYLQPSLAASQFWHHAELFDTVRLRGLMTARPPRTRMLPDLNKVFGALAERNPALLCYYFFFPAHDEPLAPPCDAIYQGREFACFAGEWACLALLLFRPSSTSPIADYRPAYVGYTGRRNAGALQGLDPERRFGMMVDPWKGWQNAQGQLVPETVDGHPKFFVARGTHSLYLEAGQHVVQPYESASYPQLCGMFDSPDALDQYRKSKPPQEKQNKAAAMVKIVGGLLLGGLPGVIAGMVAAGLEGDFPWGLEAVGSYDPPTAPTSDNTPVPGQLGKVAHPAGLSISDPGADPVPWKAEEDVPIGTRRYSFIVDRQSQVWWPSDDGTGGYRGRWGPRVVNDPFNRRTGMRFPEFWRMFFVALAKSSPTEFQ